jgi:hypothetical protein
MTETTKDEERKFQFRHVSSLAENDVYPLSFHHSNNIEQNRVFFEYIESAIRPSLRTAYHEFGDLGCAEVGAK